MGSSPLAFMSYSHFDDDNDNGYLTKFCRNLSKEVRAQTGKDFPIFQDRKDIQWGKNWRERINTSIRSVTFLIPIITPNFFESKDCTEELRLFVEHVKIMGRKDLILPIYYIKCPQIENRNIEGGELIDTIKAHQCRDWRHLRNRPFDQLRVKDELVNLAVEIRDLISYPQETTFEKSKPSVALSHEILTEKDDLEIKLVSNTIIVDINQHGDYDRISDAIDNSNPGDKILIRPGIYEESLCVNKSLEIIGDGAIGSIVVEAKGKSTLIFKTDSGHVANLSLKQNGGGNWFCVDITKGSLCLEDCDVTSLGSACIAIHNNANPFLKQNRIHHSKQCGVLVFDHGNGILENNEIFGNNFAGIEIKDFGNPILLHNMIHHGKQNGILVYDNGLGKFENNDIFDNDFPQVSIMLGGNPLLRDNRIYNGKQNGVFLYFNGLGLFENNDIFGNEYPQVAIKSSSNPLFRHNRIHNGRQNGIFIYDGGLGLFEDNDIFANEYPGIVVKIESNPIFRHNRIYDNKQNGVFVQENGRGVFEDNDIIRNEYPGVAIKTGSKPIFRYNRIYNNKQNGIFIHENGMGLIEDNEIFNNEWPQIAIETGSDPTIRSNRIFRGKKMGVFINKGLGKIEDNYIFSNAGGGIWIDTGSNPTISDNRINNNESFAIFVNSGCLGTIEDNDLRDNKAGSFIISNDSLANVKCARNLE
jgi:parallel beta-helix repeat protein